MPRKSDASGTLRRGAACLSCRRRKLRCNGARPVCHQCDTMRRGHECNYDDSARKSRTQTLREKLFALEAKVRELEHGSGTTPSPRSGTLTVQPIASTSHSSWENDGSETRFQDISQSQSWFQSYDNSNEVASTSQLTFPTSLAMPQFDSHIPMIPHAYTDSSGTPVHDAPPDRLTNEPCVTLSIEMHNLLIQSFIDHRKQCCFYSDTSRFDRSSSATIYQNTPPSPALMTAIYLIGSFFARNLPELENRLLEQTQHEVSRALHKPEPEQLMDLLQSFCLLAQYFFFNNRAMEGKLQLTSAKRISTDLGLHQIIHSDFPFEFPFDSASYSWQEKAAIFWQVVMVEKFWSSSNAFCEALPDFETPNGYITTPLPVQDGVELDSVIGNSPLHDIFEGESFRGSMLSVTAFKVIVSAVFDRSLRVNNTSMMSKDAIWFYHRVTEVALERLTVIVLPITWRDPRTSSNSRIDMDLYVVYSLIWASTILLQLDNIMNLKVSLAARKIVELINELGEEEYQFLDPVLSICWSSMVVIFRRMIDNAKERVMLNGESASTASYTITFLRHCIDVLLTALQNLSKTIPLADNLMTGLETSQAPFYPGLTKTMPVTNVF